jgi:UDP-2,3-diacylglucosamine pyrophosphatase LpxH
MKSSTQKYYLVSDLHMGGDGALQHCDYTAEFIEFLKGLEKEGPDTELLIVGDTFGFWELTLVQGVEKLDHIVAAHQAIFDQLRATGERIKITMMVGNHDYDLACNAAFAARLRAYNIYLDKSLVLIRPVGDKKIWIEHGQQQDEFNAFPDYGTGSRTFGRLAPEPVWVIFRCSGSRVAAGNLATVGVIAGSHAPDIAAEIGVAFSGSSQRCIEMRT